MPTEEQTYREGIRRDLKEIMEQVKYTNGKVRWMEKMIYALVAAVVVILADHPVVASLFAHFFLNV